MIDDLNNILTLHVIFRKGNVNQPEADLCGIQQSQHDTNDVLDSFTKCVDTPRTQNSLKLWTVFTPHPRFQWQMKVYIGIPAPFRSQLNHSALEDRFESKTEHSEVLCLHSAPMKPLWLFCGDIGARGLPRTLFLCGKNYRIIVLQKDL